MGPIEAIGKLDDLRGQVNRRVTHLGWELGGVAEQWDALGAAGGQREDHAAMLLAMLRPHLAGLARFCTDVERQIDGFVADPFGRKEE